MRGPPAIVRYFGLWAGLLLAALLAAAPALADDVPISRDMPRENMAVLAAEAEALAAECKRLGEEFDQLETVRKDYVPIDAAADRLNALIKIPGSGELMWDRIQSLADRAKALPADHPDKWNLVQENRALNVQYAQRMDQLIGQDKDLNGLGVGSYNEMRTRLNKWRLQAARRYPLARDERALRCAESEGAKAEYQRAQDLAGVFVPRGYNDVEYTEATCANLRSRRLGLERSCDEKGESTRISLNSKDAAIKGAQKSRKDLHCDDGHSLDHDSRAKCQDWGKEIARLRTERDDLVEEVRRVCAQAEEVVRNQTLYHCHMAARQRAPWPVELAPITVPVR